LANTVILVYGTVTIVIAVITSFFIDFDALRITDEITEFVTDQFAFCTAITIALFTELTDGIIFVGESIAVVISTIAILDLAVALAPDAPLAELIAVCTVRTFSLVARITIEIPWVRLVKSPCGLTTGLDLSTRTDGSRSIPTRAAAACAATHRGASSI